MPRRDIVRAAAATDEHLRRTGLQIQHRDLRGVDAAFGREIVNNTALPPGRNSGQKVIGFPALAIGLREHYGLASCRGHALQAGCRCDCREDDRVVRRPGGPAGSCVDSALIERWRSAPDGHFLERAVPGVARPLRARRRRARGGRQHADLLARVDPALAGTLGQQIEASTAAAAAVPPPFDSRFRAPTTAPGRIAVQEAHRRAACAGRLNRTRRRGPRVEAEFLNHALQNLVHADLGAVGDARRLGCSVERRNAVGRRRHRLRHPRNAFSLPARNLPEERAVVVLRRQLVLQPELGRGARVGRRAATAWARSSTRRSCSACHFKDGRGRPPAAGEPMSSMLVRISVAGRGRPRRAAGRTRCTAIRSRGKGVPGVPREADVFVTYDEVAGAYADGEPFSLRRPTYRIANLGLRSDRRAAAAVAARGARDHRPRPARGDPRGQLCSARRSGRCATATASRAAELSCGISDRTEPRRAFRLEGRTADACCSRRPAPSSATSGSPRRCSRARTTPRERKLRACGLRGLNRRRCWASPRRAKRFSRSGALRAHLAVPAARTADDPLAGARAVNCSPSLRCDACHVSELATGAFRRAARARRPDDPPVHRSAAARHGQRPGGRTAADSPRRAPSGARRRCGGWASSAR